MKINIKEWNITKEEDILLLGDVTSNKIIICYHGSGSNYETLLQDTTIARLQEKYLVVFINQTQEEVTDDFLNETLKSLGIDITSKKIDTFGVSLGAIHATNSQFLNGTSYLVAPAVKAPQFTNMELKTNVDINFYISENDFLLEEVKEVMTNSDNNYKTSVKGEIFKKGVHMWDFKENNLISLIDKMVDKIIKD